MIKKLFILLALAFCFNAGAQCTVTVNGYPTGNIYSYCTSNPCPTFTASGATSYTWMPSGINTSTISVCPSVNTTYTVTGTTGTCTATNIFQVYVGSIPGAPSLASPSSNPVIVCQGAPLTLSITPANGTALGTWYNESNWISIGSSYSPSTNIVGNTVYSVIDSSYYCPNSSPLTITVTVNPTPIVTVYATTNTVCHNTYDTLIASGASTYSWTASSTGYVLYPATGSTVEVSGTAATYTVIGTTAGCSATTSVAVNVIPYPAVSFTLVPDAAPQTWDVYPTYTSNLTSVVWYWGDGTFTPGLYPSHTYSVAGRYNIGFSFYYCPTDSGAVFQSDSVYRTANNSIVYINVLQSQTTGIAPLSIGGGQGIRLYPNPSNGLFNLSISQFDNGKTNSIEVYNTTGACVHRQIVSSSNCQIDLSSLNEGVYNISLQSNEGVVNKRGVIVR